MADADDATSPLADRGSAAFSRAGSSSALARSATTPPAPATLTRFSSMGSRAPAPSPPRAAGSSAEASGYAAAQGGAGEDGSTALRSGARESTGDAEPQAALTGFVPLLRRAGAAVDASLRGATYARGNPEELSAELFDEASSVAESSGDVSWLGRRPRGAAGGVSRRSDSHSGSPRGSSASGSSRSGRSGSGSSALGGDSTLLEALNALTASVEDVLNELSDNYTFEVQPEYRLKLRKRCARERRCVSVRCVCVCVSAR
jgi:hypothetical protein